MVPSSGEWETNFPNYAQSGYHKKLSLVNNNVHTIKSKFE